MSQRIDRLLIPLLGREGRVITRCLLYHGGWLRLVHFDHTTMIMCMRKAEMFPRRSADVQLRSSHVL